MLLVVEDKLMLTPDGTVNEELYYFTKSIACEKEFSC